MTATLALTSQAFAQNAAAPQNASPTSEQAMAARIAALEAENLSVKAENRNLRQRLDRSSQVKQTSQSAPKVASPTLTVPPATASTTPSTLPASPARNDAYAMTPSSIWNGPYMGVSLGVGGLRGGLSSSSNASIIDNPPNPPSFTTDAGSGRAAFNAGALADFYAGYSHQWGRWVGGVQAEASLGRILSPLNVTDVFNTSGDPTTTTSTETLSLNLNFMVSALGRFGYLVTPRDQIYGLAGWTFAGFSATLPAVDQFGSQSPNTLSFGAHGVTVGAGWEHEIADQWTLRAEYRFTKFQNVTVSGSISTSAILPPPFSTTAQFSNTVSPELQVVRFGLTRYFDADTTPASGAFTKAPASSAAASWTGPYLGASVGLGGQATSATTTETSINPDFTGVTPGNRQFGVGGEAGLFIGYNRQLNDDWVGGVQLDGVLSRFNENLTRTSAFNLPTFNEIFQTTAFDTLSQNWAVTASARLGRLVTPRDLVYGLAGWSFANFSTSLIGDVDVATGVQAVLPQGHTFNASGPVVGLGWEHQLAGLWTMRAEYRYTHFLDKSLAQSSAQTVANGQFLFTDQNPVSADTHVMRFGVARAFEPW
jgi:outer membrane immunogenic protein